jgi:hypothetical protein
MRKYNVTVEVNITAEIEPQGRFEWDYGSGSRAIDFEDNSYFYGETQNFVGQVNFVVEIESDGDVDNEIQRIMENVYFSGDEIEWEITSWEVTEVEEILPEITRESAIQFLQNYLFVEGLDDEFRRNLEFLLHTILVMIRDMERRDQAAVQEEAVARTEGATS